MDLKAALVCLAMSTGPALADFAADEFPPYERCALCHGLFGVSHTAKFPNLAGQDPDYLTTQVHGFLTGHRTNDGGQMMAIVTELKPEEIPVAVEWFATQDAPAPAPATDDGTGRAAYAEAGCGNCHDQAAELSGVPFLTAQHAGYLTKQMQDFQSGARRPGPLGVDHPALLPQGDATLAAIAQYLAAEPRE
ncbi:hypothetical protein ACMU_18890 [Actibacterium mucosum KCTC 23349]|uniref:Cytochrome c domain-containing protein n=1 Tax=Actibacterium mucosum KCTC 23349 TaxID=1454373 RepID=A0A037ZHK8_9RHOB|nr:hypothetical protein [Actibacterium mucosum]KAJ54290.1 hypothetical protein ACMU_18890 [Actibacterium mucosum KCTC 23349]